uniref:Uncharacterized protein n=1 Tax=Strigamia maritima TaxID=126957 RepID=T1IJT6_STRMM
MQVIMTDDIVDTNGCQIPEFSPFDPSVRVLYKSPGLLSCSGTPPFVVDIRCSYKKLWRKEDGKTDNKYALDSKSKSLTGAVRVKDDFLYVECTLKKKKIVYRDYLPFIQIKPTIEKRCNKNYENWVRETKDVIRERLSVTIVGLDSVSRLNMLRHLTKTYTYFRAFDSLIDLYGYNKVGDNTFPNIVPLLTGHFVEECWNETLRQKSLNYLKLIWKEFSQNGYRTLFGEDAPKIATFNYMKGGFYKQPTDYYLRPITLANEVSLVKKYSKANCINTRSETEFVLQWLTDFLNVFENKPTFSYVFNSRLTHDYLNHAGYADELYYKFFKNYNDSKFNNNSILIFFSDHGIRFGKIRDTYVGKVEERMPFFFLLFPPWFPLKYPLLWRNIQINKHRLTTPFDIYQTLRDIINFTGEAPVANVSERGISLFREIPSDRTCEDAAILPHWCTCHVKHPVPINSSHVTQAAGQLLSSINGILLEESSKCVELSLDKVVDARVSGISDELLRFKDSHKEVIGRKVTYGHRVAGMSDYLLTILATPSGGLFEGTVRYFEASGSYQVMGDVSRINKYGNQSACISKASLRKFCYCNQKGYKIDDSYHLFTDSIMPVVDEFVEVGCRVKRKIIYRDFFAFIQVKPEVEKDHDLNFSRWTDETRELVAEKLSVTILGLDSVSRLNMLRHMPKTFAYLRNVMDAIDLQGFTKVADNTFVNVVPMLSGLFVEECWNESLAQKPMDYLNLVWKDFAQKGFRTLYAEDFPGISAFNYRKFGFFHQPTDYYLRPFTIAAQDKMNLKEHCYNNRLEVDVVLQCDHGIRFGDILETYVGKIEERMPFYFIIFPDWFKSKYPQIWRNLKTNQNRLTTPFDIYATLKDILNFTGNVKKATIRDRGISLFTEIPTERSCEHAAILPHWCTCQRRTRVSDLRDIRVLTAARKLVTLINTKIAGESKCATLKLDNIIDAHVTGLNNKVLTFLESINDVLHRHVMYGKRISSVLSYLITIRVQPSNALFEGTVQFFESTNIYVVNNEVSRINAFGNQAACIHNTNNVELEKYCYCK